MKKTRCILVALILICLCGCGKEDAEPQEKVEVEIEAIDYSTYVSEETADSEEGGNAAGNVSETVSVAPGKTAVKVAVCGAAASDILTYAAINIDDDTYGIEVLRCDNYDSVNSMVASGEADAGFGASEVLINSYNLTNGANIGIKERVFYEPLAVFPGTEADLNNLPSKLVVAVPDGDVAVARSLHLLQQKGLITLKENTGYQACMDDVTSNPYGISIEKIDMNQDVPDMSKYGLVIMDYNHAIVFGINPEDSLGSENRNSELTDMFSICLTANQERIEEDGISAVLKALNSFETEDYIKDNFYSAVEDYR